VASINLALHRRASTIVCDLRNNEILEVIDLDPAELQDLSLSNFTKAFDAMLCPVGTESTSCTGNQPKQSLAMAIIALVESHAQISDDRATWDMLRNMYTAALWMFNPVWMNGMLHGPWQSELQPNLPEQHYFYGSATWARTYIEPKPWTVYAFACSGAFLVGFIFVGIATSDLVHAPETSSFGVADFVNLSLEPLGDSSARSNVMEVLRGLRGDDEVMYKAVGFKVKTA
jgi:hypothetical protein